MADYNIYIHSVTNGDSGQSNTKAWVSGNGFSQTKPWATSDQESQENGGSNGFAPVKQALNFVKKHPYISAAAAGVAVTAKALDTILPIYADQTGNYYRADRWENIKASVKALINPVGLALNWQQQYWEQKKQAMANDQNSMLLGDAYVNQIRRKV